MRQAYDYWKDQPGNSPDTVSKLTASRAPEDGLTAEPTREDPRNAFPTANRVASVGLEGHEGPRSTNRLPPSVVRESPTTTRFQTLGKRRPPRLNNRRWELQTPIRKFPSKACSRAVIAGSAKPTKHQTVFARLQVQWLIGEALSTSRLRINTKVPSYITALPSYIRPRNPSLSPSARQQGKSQSKQSFRASLSSKPSFARRTPHQLEISLLSQLSFFFQLFPFH